MKCVETTALKKILALKKRLKVVQGGTGAGKTLAILLLLIDRAQREKNKIFSVVSATLPHLKKGAIRDFLSIMEGHNYYDDARWNRSDQTYLFETGTRIEFFGADEPSKVRGPRRDVCFINEADRVSYETFNQLDIRTSGDFFIDYNPVVEFWAHNEIIAKNQEHDFLVLTYKDNEALPKSVVEKIESRKDNKNWWKVYGLGQLGETESRIFTGWNVIDEIPHEARLERRGMDLGYSADPTAVIALYRFNGGWILDEELYQVGMLVRQMAETMKNLPEPQTLILADSAEPRTIEELRQYGLNILPAKKGPDSVRAGIQFIQGERISVTKRSINLLREYRTFCWKTDAEGRMMNVPEAGDDHAIDALRYGLSDRSLKTEDDTSILRAVREHNLAEGFPIIL